MNTTSRILGEASKVRPPTEKELPAITAQDIEDIYAERI